MSRPKKEASSGVKPGLDCSRCRHTKPQHDLPIAQHRPQLVSQGERRQDFAIARATLGLPVGRQVQPIHQPAGPGEFGPLIHIGLLKLVDEERRRRSLGHVLHH